MGKISGPFHEILPEFQKYKKSLGYKFDNIKSYQELDTFLGRKKITTLENTFEIFDVAVEKEPNEKKKKKRYLCLKELYDFMNIIGYENLYFKYDYSFKTCKSNVAVILTEKEIKTFFQKADEYSKNFVDDKKNIYPVLFRLIYSCGLRVNEARTLKTSDLSIKQGTILIEKSKRNKMRILPLSDSMLKILSQYQKNRKKEFYLFGIRNKLLSYQELNKVFHDITRDMRPFRIHDLRHSFCVNTFNRLLKKHKNENWILYLLHIYLGHNDISSTEYYLHFTKSSVDKIVKNSLLSSKYILYQEKDK